MKKSKNYFLKQKDFTSINKSPFLAALLSVLSRMQKIITKDRGSNQYLENKDLEQLPEDIIDITDTITPPIQEVLLHLQSGNAVKKKSEVNWTTYLSLPYERGVMQNQQVKQETIRMYNNLCNYADFELNKKGKSLLTEINRISSLRGYYDNLPYTFYCIAEGHVVEKYSGRRHYYDYTYSYDILQRNLGIEIKENIYRKALELEELLSQPNQITISEFHLTANGKPYVWWDDTGELRELLSIDKKELSILRNTPSRDTKIWSLLPIKTEIIKLYLSVWEIICKDIENDLKWKKTSKKHIENILDESNKFIDYEEKTNSFLLSLIKITENAVRSLLPKSSYTQSLNIEYEEYQINLYLPKATADQIRLHLSSYQQEMTKRKLKNMVKALADSEAGTWKIIVEELLLAENSDDYMSTIAKYQNSPDYDKFLKEIMKRTSDENLLLVCLYEIARRDKLTPALIKRLDHIIYEQNMDMFKKCISEKRPINSEILTELINLKRPVRKVINLDTSQIERSKKELNQTVSDLDEFLPQEAEGIIEIQNKAVNNNEKSETECKEVRNAHIYSQDAVYLLTILLKNNTVFVQEVKDKALQKGKLLNTYISDINKEFFEEVGDQLLLVEDDIVKIDDYYVDLTKELLKYEN